MLGGFFIMDMLWNYDDLLPSIWKSFSYYKLEGRAGFADGIYWEKDEKNEHGEGQKEEEHLRWHTAFW